MECVCGCGREVSKKLADRNFLAATIALELLVWDKNRALSEAGPEGREGLIARGVECYEQLLYVLHGEGGGEPDAGCNAWIEESIRMRASQSRMTKKRLLGSTPPRLDEEDMARLDRRHPEQSFTGARAAPAGGGPAADDDLVEKLERLRALHAEAALTEAEFAAAKARLLGEGGPPHQGSSN